MSRRCYAEPIYCPRWYAESVCSELNVIMEYYVESHKDNYSIAYFSMSPGETEEDISIMLEALISYDERTEIHFIPDNAISLPSKFFSLRSSDFRICESKPTKVGQRFIYEFENNQTKEMIFKNFDLFIQKPDWTHFLALPFSVNDPNYRNSINNLLIKWRLKPNSNANLAHITIALFVVKCNEDIELFSTTFQEAIDETEWPQDHTIQSKNIGVFGSQRNSRILYLDPKGQVLDSLMKCKNIFYEKMQDKGIAYIEVTDIFHITLLRPKNVSNQKKFDSTKMLKNFSDKDIPDICVNEFRLVQRFVFDEDKFYHTVKRYSIPYPDGNSPHSAIIDEKENTHFENDQDN